MSHEYSPGLQHEHRHAHAEQHGGNGKYIVVFLALCVLTGASFFTTSSYWPFKASPHVGWAFMMAVSCTKAMLVILFFMHLLWEANWKYVLTIPAAGMSIFLVCMLIPDVGRRASRYSEERQIYAVERQVGEHGQDTGPQAGADHSNEENRRPPADAAVH
jgi:cytochrome c oxidase subunit 4